LVLGNWPPQGRYNNFKSCKGALAVVRRGFKQIK
jgi:hypothetical protein